MQFTFFQDPVPDGERMGYPGENSKFSVTYELTEGGMQVPHRFNSGV